MEDKAVVAKTLKADVALKYELAPGTPIVGFFPKYGELDLSTMTLADADAKVKSGFRWLTEKGKPAKQADDKK